MRRPRLVRELAGRFDRRLTVVVAGAGYGKTTLLAQFPQPAARTTTATAADHAPREDRMLCVSRRGLRKFPGAVGS